MGRKAKSILVGVALLAVGLIAPAHGATQEVEPGESIQAAIDAAQPGDTIIVRPGNYAESLEIDKEGIKLLGSGAVLKPPKKAPATACNEPPDFVVGVCIPGEFDEETFPPAPDSKPLANVKVDGFTIEGFGMGIFAVVTENVEVSHNVFSKNQAYGAFAIASSGARFLYNSAKDSGFAAYYIGDSPKADATVVGNSAEGSYIGLFYRSALGARVADNVFSGNCAGVLAASDPTPAGDLTLTGNEIHHNNKFCGPEEGHDHDEEREEDYQEESQQAQEAEEPQQEEPTFSGIGIVLSGAKNVIVQRNNIWGNEPSEEADVAGGIVVMTDPFTDALPSDVLVRWNRAFDNKPADLVWDESGVEIGFVDNQCVTSQPKGLC